MAPLRVALFLLSALAFNAIGIIDGYHCDDNYEPKGSYPSKDGEFHVYSFTIQVFSVFAIGRLFIAICDCLSLDILFFFYFRLYFSPIPFKHWSDQHLNLVCTQQCGDDRRVAQGELEEWKDSAADGQLMPLLSLWLNLFWWIMVVSLIKLQNWSHFMGKTKGQECRNLENVFLA